MSNMIRFANHAQEILMECELKGQISDGNWENSLPHDHYKCMCEAKITHANDANDSRSMTGAVIGKNFRPRRKYNFLDKGLLEVVQERMIGAVKFYTAFPDVSYDNHWDFGFEGTAQQITKGVMEGLNQVSGYYRDKAERIIKAVGAKDIDELTEAMQKVDRVEYDAKMLRRDLKQMKEIVNG